MTRLARSPSPWAVGMDVRRRTVLRALLGAAGLTIAPATALAACARPAGEEQDITFGSNASDPAARRAIAQVVAGFEKETGENVTINTVNHDTFSEQATTYLQGRPDDVFTWFAGYRMQFFAAQGLAADLSEVWERNGKYFNQALRNASTGADGNQYFVPFTYYPWAVFYRKSVFRQNGYEVPETLDDFVALCEQMRRDRLVPIAFANAEGWPAMGTFDHLNLRINGYEFHRSLMSGREPWVGQKVREVFDTWERLLPHHQPGAARRTWEQAGLALATGKAGMYLMGMFVGARMPAAATADFDFFTFPEVDSAIGTTAVEAPVDGFMVSRRPSNGSGAMRLLDFLAGPKAQAIGLGDSHAVIAANNRADTSHYTPLQRKAVDLVDGATNVSQFLDRDTRPDFASSVIVPALTGFLKEPSEIGTILRTVEDQKKAIFTE
jgi:multiple sugar transport system substrate-binding protein